MDGHIRDEHEIAVKGKQLADERISFSDEHTAGDGKRTVHPGRAEHATIPFGIQLQISAFAFQFSAFLDLEGRRIAVRGRQLEMIIIQFLTDGKRDHAGAIAGRVILSALFQLPAVTFVQLCITCFFQQSADRADRMKAARALLDQ